MIRDKESQVIETYMIWPFCLFHPVGEWNDASLRQKCAVGFIDSILRNASCKMYKKKTNVLYQWNEYYFLIR